jgi:hypothetical protein
MPNRAAKTEIASDKTLDATLAALLQGYEFIRRRCERLGSDAFTTRAMLQKATCVMGEDAARMFYAPGRFTRVGAMPVMTLMLLQDFDSVQMLDGAALRHRKDMFLALATPPQIARLEQVARKEWRAHRGVEGTRPDRSLRRDVRGAHPHCLRLGGRAPQRGRGQGAHARIRRHDRRQRHARPARVVGIVPAQAHRTMGEGRHPSRPHGRDRNAPRLAGQDHRVSPRAQRRADLAQCGGR